MPYVLPTFNITCNIWHQMGAPVVPPTTAPDIADQPCQLRYPGRGPSEALFDMGPPGGEQVWQPGMHLLLPPLVDIRDALMGTGADVVEVPAGTGRYYGVHYVDDIGKGFPNEHRWAILIRFFATPPLP